MVRTIKGPVMNFSIGLIKELATAKTKPVITISTKSPLKIMPGTKYAAINMPIEFAIILATKLRMKRIYFYSSIFWNKDNIHRRGIHVIDEFIMIEYY